MHPFFSTHDWFLLENHIFVDSIQENVSCKVLGKIRKEGLRGLRWSESFWTRIFGYFLWGTLPPTPVLHFHDLFVRLRFGACILWCLRYASEPCLEWLWGWCCNLGISVQVRASSERTCSTVASYMHLPQPIPVTCCFEIVVISDGCFTCANEMVGNWLETWNEWVEKRWWVELPKLAMFFNSLSECLYVRECRCACSYAWNWCFNNKTVSRMQQNVQLAGACVLASWWKIELPVEVFLWWEVPQRTLWSGWLFLIITSMTMIFLGSILESHSSRGDVESWRFRTFPPLSPNKQGTKTFPEEIEVAGSLDFLILHLPARWLRCVLNRFR